MEVKGTIDQILDIESGVSKAGKEWNKQSIVIDTGDQYNPLVCISFFGDKLDLLNNLMPPQRVIVHVNLSSREFNGKWYHNIDGWKIDLDSGDESQSADASVPPAPIDDTDESDDLPF